MALFGDNGAPDSFDGRFDIMVLHVHLVLRRLRAEGLPARHWDKIYSTGFSAIWIKPCAKWALVIWVSVRKFAKMAQAYYGRAAAYDEGNGQGDARAASKTAKP